MKTGAVATLIAFFLGIFCARKIMKLRPGARAVLDGVLTMPLVLPPTVAGFLLLMLFSLRRPFGEFLLKILILKWSRREGLCCGRGGDRLSSDVQERPGGF